MRTNRDFFARKRPWSNIKDSVLTHYLPPYLAKVSHLGKPILLVDAFAGAGVFDDGTLGSPLFMCQEAERFAPNRYHAIFVNKEAEEYSQLEANLRARGWTKMTTCIHGDARELLRRLPLALGDQTLFLYMDPFGLRGCEFKLLEPFLTRGTHLSTEILFLMHMPIIHRLAMARQAREGRVNPRVASGFHKRLTEIFGGTYWQDILWDAGLEVEVQERLLMGKYAARLREYLPYAHFCPVRQSQERRVKYYLVFASRHQDTMLLMNDIMAKAYHQHMHQERNKDTLWEMADWRDMRAANEFTDDLERAIMMAIHRQPAWTRDGLWAAVVADNFMQYTPTEYLDTLKQLASCGQISYERDPKTKRHNGNSRVAWIASSDR